MLDFMVMGARFGMTWFLHAWVGSAKIDLNRTELNIVDRVKCIIIRRSDFYLNVVVE